jgi:hypothetical protein
MFKRALTVGFILLMILSACGKKTETPPTPTPSPTLKPEPTTTPTPRPTATEPPEPAEAPGYDQAIPYSGRWEGQWRNITFGSNGKIEVEVIIYPDGRAEISIDIGGFVFGMIDPDPKTYLGTYDADGAVFEVEEDPVFGTVVVTLSFASGEIVGTTEDIPDPTIARMESTGMMTPEEVTGVYTVFFAGGGEATGDVTLTKVAE